MVACPPMLCKKRIKKQKERHIGFLLSFLGMSKPEIADDNGGQNTYSICAESCRKSMAGSFDPYTAKIDG